MNVDLPSWLNKDFLKTALENGETSKGVEVINFEVKKAVPKGNNYMCDILRVKVEYRVKCARLLSTKSLIIKVPIKGGVNDYILNFGIIQREVAAYREFLPKLCRLLGGENEYLTAKSFPSTEENVLVLDDLNADGYKMADRLDQLDFEHSVVALKHLAKFHAASVKIHEEEPELVESVGRELMFRRDSEKDQRFILGRGPIELLIIELNTWPESKDYIESINRQVDVSFDKLVDCMERDENEFNVLNHGDFWVTNMLYKYDRNGKPTRVKFIDLQIMRYASPALDLIYLFNGSVQEEIRKSRYEELINIYVDSLNENMNLFDCQRRVEASEIFEAVERRQFYAFYANITLLPVVVQDTDTIMEMKEMTENDLVDLANNPFRKYIQTEKFKKLFSKRIKEFGNVLN